MQKIHLTIVLLILSLSVTAQKVTIKVLFIGNSLTFVNDLPGTLQKVAHSAGDSIYVDASAIPGYTLYQHVHDTSTLNKIKRKKWDYVVIQEQSQIPSFPPAQVDTQFYPYAHILDSLIHLNDSCTHTVFYLTPGHKYGDKANCGSYSILCTYDGVQSRLRQSYLHAADTNKAIVAPVGIAWYHSWHTDSTLNLWQSDYTHPTIAGAYLSACTFYSTLTRKDCNKVTYVTSGITVKQANYLRNIASHTVIDSMAVWYIGVFDPHAIFTYKPSGSSITFINKSKNASHFIWLFGDSKTSSLITPTHTYSSKTAYTVKCIAFKDCMSDTAVQTIYWTGTESIAAHNSSLKIYPNPSHTSTTFELTGFYLSNRNEITITDALGRIIENKVLTGTKWIWEHETLQTGIYFIKVNFESGYTITKSFTIN